MAISIAMLVYQRVEAINTQSILGPTQIFSFYSVYTFPKSLRYPLVICYIAIEHGPVEIVSFPIKIVWIFHSFC